MPRLLSFIALLCVLLVPLGAHADDTYGWLMPTPEEQLFADESVIPVGMGAIFVPSITGAELEPPASLATDVDVVSIPLGERYFIDPGRYVVIVSSGSPAHGVGVAIEVVEGETTLVPVQWGALRIEVTDANRIPHRGSYELTRLDTREPVGTGFGADTLQGEFLQTWLVPPGLYRVAPPGRDSRSMRDFATVAVPEGGFVRFRLVQDSDSGEFLGAGVLLPDDLSSGGRGDERWFSTLVVGLDGSVVNNSNVVGVFNQTQVSAAGSIDGQLVFTDEPNRISLLAQLEEGASQVRPQGSEPLAVVKSTDRLRADLLYTRSWGGAMGPYARAGGQSQAFPTSVLASEDTTFRVRELDGSLRTDAVQAGDSWRLADAWQPTLLRQGVGLNTRFLRKNRSVTFNWRVGLGLRQSLYEGALVLDDSASTQVIEYVAVESFNERGLETTVVATVRLPGWVIWSTDLELFAEPDNLGQPAVNWRNTLSLRISRGLSLNYFSTVDFEPRVIDRMQVQQSLVLRASWTIF